MQSGPHSNVTASLSDLERKLADLERELGADPLPGAPAPPVSDPEAAADRAPEAPVAPPAPPAAGLREEIADLRRIRDQLESAARDLVAEYDRLVSRLQDMEAAAARSEAPAPTADAAEPSS